MEPREIDLKILFTKTILHWRKLLILIILFAAIGGTFAYIKGGKDISGDDSTQADTKDYDSIVESIKIYHDILDEDYRLLTESEIDYETRNNIINEISLTKNMIASEKKDMSKEELSYIEAVLAGEDAGLSLTSDTDSSQNTSNTKDIIKYAGIGVVLAIFLFGFVYAIIFIFDSKLNNVDDIENVFDIKLFCLSDDSRSKKFIFDKWLYSSLDKGKHLYKEDDLVDIVSTNIKLINKDKSKVVIAGRYSDDVRKGIIDKIIKQSFDNGITVVYASDILYDAKSLDMLSDAAYVVLSEKEDVSLYEEVVKEIKLLKEFDVKIVGCIV